MTTHPLGPNMRSARRRTIVLAIVCGFALMGGLVALGTTPIDWASASIGLALALALIAVLVGHEYVRCAETLDEALPVLDAARMALAGGEELLHTQEARIGELERALGALLAEHEAALARESALARRARIEAGVPEPGDLTEGWTHVSGLLACDGWSAYRVVAGRWKIERDAESTLREERYTYGSDAVDAVDAIRAKTEEALCGHDGSRDSCADAAPTTIESGADRHTPGA